MLEGEFETRRRRHAASPQARRRVGDPRQRAAFRAAPSPAAASSTCSGRSARTTASPERGAACLRPATLPLAAGCAIRAWPEPCARPLPALDYSSPESPMPRLVMKFGGTSVATVERIRNVARHVKREVEAGYDVAVVVSAMAGKTNELVAWCKEASAPLRSAGIRRGRRLRRAGDLRPARHRPAGDGRRRPAPGRAGRSRS